MDERNAAIINATTPEGYKHGCHNRKPFRPYSTLRHSPMEHPLKVIQVPHRMSTDCRYDLRLADKACKGCTWQTPAPPAATP